MDKLLFVTVPYAGGNSTAFIKMFSHLKEADMFYYDYPGHGSRANEQFLPTIQQAAADLAGRLFEKNRRYCIFGHSMGGMTAYYCEMLLEKKYGVSAEKLIISACSSPEDFYSARLSLRSEKDIAEYLAEKRKIPPEIISMPAFKKTILNQFENDVKVINNYTIGDTFKVRAPMICIYGSDDEDIDESNIRKWQNHAETEIEVFCIKGGHFFIESASDDVLSVIEGINLFSNN